MKNVLEALKKNVLSLVCLLVALLAVVAVFVWPLPAKQTELQQKLEARKSELDALDGLAKKARKVPQVDPNATDVKQLDGFPNDKVITVGQQIVQQMTSESKAAEELALKINEHQLLHKESLPAPTEPVAFEYKDKYTAIMDLTGQDRSQTLAVRVLKAGVPPTPEEVAAERVRKAKEIQDNEGVPGQNDKQIAERIARMQASLVEDMRAEVAARSQMYMNNSALDVYPGIIGATKPPAAAVIYYSPIGLWVQEDVCSALAAANASSDGVAHSAVKHLLTLDVTETGTGAPAAPGATPDPNAAAAKKTPSLSGRTSSDKYDVIPFHLVIYVDAAKVPQVLASLSRDKFITVNKVDLATVDIAAQTAAGYYYGDNPSVVMLTIDGEELFLRSWLAKYIPKDLTTPPATPG